MILFAGFVALQKGYEKGMFLYSIFKHSKEDLVLLYFIHESSYYFKQTMFPKGTDLIWFDLALINNKQIMLLDLLP